jgi:hypothetical protein
MGQNVSLIWPPEMRPICLSNQPINIAAAHGLRFDIDVDSISLRGSAGSPLGRETMTLSGLRAFELAGVEFIDENGGGPGLRLRKAHQHGKRK